jgi:signal transduction histidine kinase/CheY-like chemotaxis protein
MDVVTLAIEVLFSLVFIGALVSAIRGRDPLAWDVTFVCASLGQLFVLQLVGQVIKPLPIGVSIVAVFLLLAQPVFVLRLVSRFRPVPRWLVPLGVAGLLATGIPLALAGSPASRELALLAVVEFAAADALASAYLLREARRRAGSARIRLSIAAASTVAVAAVFLLAAASPASAPAGGATPPPSPTQIGSLLIALAAALGYVVAFLPPRMLRRFWLASALYEHGQALMSSPAQDDDAVLWARFTAVAEAITGTTALVVEEDDEGAVRVVSGGGPFTIGQTIASAPGAIAAVTASPSSGLVGVPTGSPLIDDLARTAGARFAGPVAIRRVSLTPLLVLLSSHPTLFGSDDAELLAALGTRAAMLVERRRVLAEQQRLSARLASTVIELENANKAKSDFLASMSHELRTPLSAIIGFSDLMRHEPHAPQGGLVVPDDWVENVHRSGQHLLGLINDVLDLAKVEAGRLELNKEPVDVEAAIVESVAGLRPLAMRKALEIEVTVEPMSIEVDRGRLRQMLYNLLSNAIKYTGNGGGITVRGSRSGDELYLSVADTGIGISAEDQTHIFEEFRQVGEPSARESGTGLGLALTRRLVEAHGGRIEVESTPSVGSTFTVILPGAVERLVHTRVPTIERVAGSGTPGDVLVIEDDDGAATLLRAYLESDGYSVRVAQDGEAGLAAARAQVPSAILLDVLLPGMDGWDVLNAIKSDEVLRGVPVVFVTALDQRDIGLALGAVDYLVKPVQREVLLDCLARNAFTGAPTSNRSRVLAIDDDPASLDMIEAFLQPSGFEVLRADGGAEGLALAQREQPDLVICDLLMPHVDGFGVVAAMKADARTRDVPILILTAHELTAGEKDLLNGKILGLVAKGEIGKDGLSAWLAKAIRVGAGTGPPA